MVARDPLPISVALSELIALRGFARVRSENELDVAWKEIAGPELSAHTRPQPVSRGTLTVLVDNPPLLNELATFGGAELLQKLKKKIPHLNIKKLKFKLGGI